MSSVSWAPTRWARRHVCRLQSRPRYVCRYGVQNAGAGTVRACVTMLFRRFSLSSLAPRQAQQPDRTDRMNGPGSLEAEGRLQGPEPQLPRFPGSPHPQLLLDHMYDIIVQVGYLARRWAPLTKLPHVQVPVRLQVCLGCIFSSPMPLSLPLQVCPSLGTVCSVCRAQSDIDDNPGETPELCLCPALDRSTFFEVPLGPDEYSRGHHVNNTRPVHSHSMLWALGLLSAPLIHHL